MYGDIGSAVSLQTKSSVLKAEMVVFTKMILSHRVDHPYHSPASNAVRSITMQAQLGICIVLEETVYPSSGILS